MAISKVIYKSSASAQGETWMDATPATAEAADIISPKTAMLADGVVTQGTGSSGSSTLSGLTDVDISNPTDGQTLVYNATSGKWENGAGKAWASYFTVLYEFTGTILTTVTLSEDAERYQLLAFQIYDSNGDMINAVTLPPRAFRNTVVKIYGSSSSQWGSFKLETDDGTGLLTTGTFNRTSTNTERVRVLGIGRVA